MEEFLAYIIKNLVSFPDSVLIKSSTEGENVKLEIHVSPEDVGKVIGRKGNTIHALRTIIRSISSRMRQKITVDLIQNHKNNSVKQEKTNCESIGNHSCCCSSFKEESLEESFSEKQVSDDDCCASTSHSCSHC